MNKAYLIPIIIVAILLIMILSINNCNTSSSSTPFTLNSAEVSFSWSPGKSEKIAEKHSDVSYYGFEVGTTVSVIYTFPNQSGNEPQLSVFQYIPNSATHKQIRLVTDATDNASEVVTIQKTFTVSERSAYALFFHGADNITGEYQIYSTIDPLEVHWKDSIYYAPADNCTDESNLIKMVDFVESDSKSTIKLPFKFKGESRGGVKLTLPDDATKWTFWIVAENTESSEAIDVSNQIFELLIASTNVYADIALALKGITEEVANGILPEGAIPCKVHIIYGRDDWKRFLDGEEIGNIDAVNVTSHSGTYDYQSGEEIFIGISNNEFRDAVINLNVAAQVEKQMCKMNCKVPVIK